MSSTAIIICLIGIALAIVLNYKFGVNMGVTGLAVAWIAGCIVMGLKVKDVVALWPNSVVFQLMSITLFFGFAVVNGTMQAIANHTRAMGGYTLRLVDNMGGLMEKVLINDAGLDDVVIEMCKFVTKMEMAGKMEKSAAATFMGTPFHFYRIRGEGDDRLITFMYPSDGTMKGVDIGYNVYEDCTGIVERNPHIKPGSGFERIDASWLNSIMK